MALLRRELTEYARASEHLMTDSVPFTHEEREWIGYYMTEMTNFAEQRVPVRRPDVVHTRQTLGDYTVATRALLLVDELSEREQDLIRLLVSEVRREILGEQAEGKVK